MVSSNDLKDVAIAGLVFFLVLAVTAYMLQSGGVGGGEGEQTAERRFPLVAVPPPPRPDLFQAVYGTNTTDEEDQEEFNDDEVMMRISPPSSLVLTTILHNKWEHSNCPEQ
jgi:hypothetical protein